MELSSYIYSGNRFNWCFAPSATNSGYKSFLKWPPAAILIFLGAPIFNSYSPKSKCNTSKLVDFMPIKPIIWLLRQKNDNVTPGGSKTQILTENDPNIDIMLKSSQFGLLDNT